MKLEPYTEVDGTAFSASPDAIRRARGEPLKALRNGVCLNELDYGDAVFRLQDSDRLEEITVPAPVVYIGNVDVPFAALERFVRSGDDAAFERGGFVVSPRFGVAFDPRRSPWFASRSKRCRAADVIIEQSGLPDVIPLEMCYLGWQESLAQFAQLVEPEISG